MNMPNILVFGGPNCGKTHYAAQLLGRLKRKSGNLKIRVGDGSSTNLNTLEHVLTRLEDGNAADHTPADHYSEILLPLVDERDNKFELHWPDYGGEQVSNLFKSREFSSNWRVRLENSDGWVLFIRLSGETIFPEDFSRLTASATTTLDMPKRPDIWDANAYYIELIQMLCHLAGRNISYSTDKPPLALVLSCYDELNPEDKTPSIFLQKKLPLFFSFIHSIWPADKLSVWGVSSLGKELNFNSNDDAFIDDGPENQGWVIRPHSLDKNDDLTQPLSWVLEQR
ncbi:hypothetical protein ACRQTN_07225 [Pectobacterium brasiliense]|uniref:TRAFAC clade GTPase domain-containing protein n=1 Tax=Pectobacterium brasiliense TaxID=180957 RepID=UPI003EBBE682